MATPNDQAILNAIINPLLPAEEFKSHSTNEDDDEKDGLCYEPNVEQAKAYEKEGVLFAETGELEEALLMFNKAISLSPTWASAYNNKAQVLRLLRRNEEAMENLDMAIEFSQGMGNAASQAYCQRAMLYTVMGQEEKAFKDWESSAKLGNSFARSQLIQRNPYAALCNKMLNEVFQNLKAAAPSSVE